VSQPVLGPGPAPDGWRDEVARRWARVRDLDRHPVPGSLEHELTIIEHLKWISAAYAEEPSHGRRQPKAIAARQRDAGAG